MKVTSTGFGDDGRQLALAFLLLGFFQIVRIGLWNIEPEYQLPHFYFTYELEFLKRALLGHVFSLFDAQNLATIKALHAVVLTFLYLGMFFVAQAGARRFGNVIWWLSILAAASPGFLAIYSSDLIRPDVYLILIMAVSLTAIMWLNQWLGFAIAVTGQLIALLIHEMALFATALPLMGLWYLCWPSRRNFTVALCGAAALIAATLFVAITGSAEAVGFEELQKLYAERHGSAKGEAVKVLYNAFWDSVRWTTRNTFKAPFLYYHIAYLVLMFPVFWVVVAFFRKTHETAPGGQAIRILIVLSPLALSPIGIDQYRWNVFALVNVFALMCLAAVRSADGFSNFADSMRARPRLLAASVGFYVLLAVAVTIVARVVAAGQTG